MTEARIFTPGERTLARRLKRLATDLRARARALTETVTNAGRERQGLVRDLADAQAELSEARSRVFGYSAERRALEVERLSARVADLETRITQLDAESARLKAAEASAQADSGQAGRVFDSFRKQVLRAVDPHFYDELWS